MVKQRLEIIFFNKYVYGLLFVAFLPALLLYWSYGIDKLVEWPVPHWPIISVLFLISGGILSLKGIYDLYRYGKGLPMNAYPPRIFVTKGAYAWFSHPIYVGAFFLSFGASLWFQSGSGLYLITPVLALMMVSLVFGYERFIIKKIVGNSVIIYNPIFGLPSTSENRASLGKKMAMLVIIFIPWLASGYLIDWAHSSGTIGAYAKLFSILNWHDWVSVIWIVPYIYIAIRILMARTGRSLYRSAVTGILAVAIGIYLYLILPPFGVELTGNLWILILVSLVSTCLAIIHHQVWSILRKYSECVANSRHDWLFFNGRFRIINHSLYSGLAGAVGTGIVSYITDNNYAALVLLLCALLGAALFAQLRWANTSLRRPFGFWGGILGGIAGFTAAHFWFGVPISQIALAGVLCATFVQAIGRLRCLAQGCCHGILTRQDLGIRVWQKQSRVVTISGLEGRYILITQLYSILFNILLGFLLWSIWLSDSVNSWFIIGLYLIMTGIERFTEDAYRGEVQTKMAKGLKENQWIAIIAIVIGIIITTIPGPASLIADGQFDIPYWSTVVLGGLITSFAMSMDFPKSNIRFSRLSG
jgi:protein-S-isoprenylcysteine O-methyltransferase Ste14